MLSRIALLFCLALCLALIPSDTYRPGIPEESREPEPDRWSGDLEPVERDLTRDEEPGEDHEGGIRVGDPDHDPWCNVQRRRP